MYQLFARMYGTNNLPDSSNMCHETTSVALPESLGVPVGTCVLEDFPATDAIFFFGQNVGSNSSPHAARPPGGAPARRADRRRSTRCASAGWKDFTNPQSAARDAVRGRDADRHPVSIRSRRAATWLPCMGMCKALIAWDDAKHNGGMTVLDRDFIHEHTHGFAELADAARAAEWAAMERRSGLTRDAMEATAAAMRAPTRSSSSTAWG